MHLIFLNKAMLGELTGFCNILSDWDNICVMTLIA